MKLVVERTVLTIESTEESVVNYGRSPAKYIELGISHGKNFDFLPQ